MPVPYQSQRTRKGCARKVTPANLKRSSSALSSALGSTVVLAGGRSERMGKDKAFLTYCGDALVNIVVKKALSVGEKVVVCIGNKSQSEFRAVLPKDVLIMNDNVNYGTPLSGVQSGFEALREGYAAVVGCDMPLIRREVLLLLFRLAEGHSAAVPRWPDGNVEPLLAVYSVEDTLEAIRRASPKGVVAPRRIFEYMHDPLYVGIDVIRRLDPKLESLVNVNTPAQYRRLRLDEKERCGK